MPTFREDPKIGTKVPLIKTADLNDKSVTEKKLADGSITKDKIATGAVTSEKIAEGAVSVDEIKDLSVEESKINNKAVTNVKIGDAAVDTRTIEDKSVTNAKIADESVSAEKLQSGLRSTIVSTHDKAIELDKKKANVTDVDYALERLENKIGDRVVVEGNVTNLPDDEDLTSVSTIDGREVMKLNDRAYEPSNFSGKGYKILRKNIQRLSLPTATILVSNIPSSSGDIAITINGKTTTVALDVATDTTTAIIATKIGTALKTSLDDYDVSVSSNTIVLTRNNSQSALPSSIDVGNTTAGITVKDSITKSERRNVLTQDMINDPNTVYEIRYDFDLNGNNISISQGGVLKFEGGILKNGSLACKYTEIKTNCECFDNVHLHGTIANHTINIDWWIMPIENNKYYAYQLNSLVKLTSNNTILFGDKTYKAITDELVIYDGISISGHNTTILYLYSQNENSKFYIGISKKCSMSNLCIYVYEKREISILYTESTMSYIQDYNADWRQTINNITIENLQYFVNNSEINNINTIGILFNVSKYNYKGDLIIEDSKGNFSYKGNYKNIKLKYFNIGIKLNVEKPNWCNSIHFYNIELWTGIGVYYSGNTGPRFLIDTYLYQRLVGHVPVIAPIYGNFASLFVSNMVVWDTDIRGIVNGIIYDNATCDYNSNNYGIYSGYKKLDEDKKLIVYSTPPLANNVSFLSSFKKGTVNTLRSYSYMSGAQLIVAHEVESLNNFAGTLNIQDLKEETNPLEAFKVSVDYNSSYNKNNSYTLYYENGDVVQFNKGKKRQINNIFSDSNFTNYCVGDILYDNHNYLYLFKNNKEQLRYFDTYEYYKINIANTEEKICEYYTFGNAEAKMYYCFSNENINISGTLTLSVNASRPSAIINVIPRTSYFKIPVTLALAFKIYYKKEDNKLSIRVTVNQTSGYKLLLTMKVDGLFNKSNIEESQLPLLKEVNVPVYLSKSNPNSLGETRFFDNNLHVYNGEKFLKLKAIECSLDKGNSNQRPTDVAEGFQYYDTTLKKYIVWNGTEWTNMDGTAL